MYMLELKIIISEIKYSLDGVDSSSDTVEKRINELEYFYNVPVKNS